jgi:hypothetical protein
MRRGPVRCMHRTAGGRMRPPGQPQAQLESSARSDWRGERLVASAAVGS